MKSMKAIVLVAALATSLGGCAYLQGVIGAVAGHTTVGQDTLRAANIGLHAYYDIYQGPVLAYGHLNTCGTAGATIVCKDQAFWDKLKSYDAKAVSAINVAKPVLDALASGNAPTNTDAISNAMTAVTEAEAVATQGGIVTPKETTP